MNKYLQSLLIILTISIAIGARFTVLGWLGIIGIGTAVIFGIAHVYIHFYSMNYLASRSARNVAFIFLSHLFFLGLFLFQTDGGDEGAHLVFDYIRGVEGSPLMKISTIILIISFIGYVITSTIIVYRARKAKIPGTSHGLLISTIVLSIVGIFIGMYAFSSLNELGYIRERERMGEYSSIKRAKRNEEKVLVLNLDVYNTSYSSIPKEVFEMTNLQEIYFSEGKITDIPSEIVQLKELRVLDLTGNNIKEINPAICELKKLQDLRIGGDIKTLPDCLTQLQSLQNLTIQSNTANTLMDELRKFKQLKTAHFYLKDGVFDTDKWNKLREETGIGNTRF